MIKKYLNGWKKNSCWDNSKEIEKLYYKRSLNQVEDLTCHTQAASILKAQSKNNETLLDIGCGTGYFYHALRNQKINLKYYGLDPSEKLIGIGKKNISKFNLNSKRLFVGRIEDLNGSFDHVVCINVITYLDNIYKYLEILLKVAKKSVILRESFYSKDIYKYVPDNYLNKGVIINTYINTYSKKKVTNFLKKFNCDICFIKDKYTNGKPQKVIDHNHYWSFLNIKKNNKD